MPTITVYSDYVCPFCLLAENVLSTAINGRDIRIRWRAFELRPAPIPTLRPEDPYLPNSWRQSVYPLAKKLGVPIKLPSISPQPRTDKAFKVLLLAQDKGLDHPYSMRILQAFFQENQDIGDPEVLITLAAEIGLDPVEVQQALNSDVYSQRHQQALHHAREEMLLTSVPTIFVGNRVFRGTPSLKELKQAIDELDADNSLDVEQLQSNNQANRALPLTETSTKGASS